MKVENQTGNSSLNSEEQPPHATSYAGCEWCRWGFIRRSAYSGAMGARTRCARPIIRGSCDRREAAGTAGVVPMGSEMWGQAAPALRLSLRHNPLVNSVDGAWKRWLRALDGGSNGLESPRARCD